MSDRRRPRYTRKPPPFPVELHNRFGEWRNPYHDDLLELRVVLEKLPPDYDASAAYISIRRPTKPNECLRWWNTMEARAHALIALLQRGPRTMAQLHQDMNVGHDKVYTYLPRWKVQWTRRPDKAVAQDASGQRYPVTVERWHWDTPGLATVRFQSVSIRAPARWLPDAWEFSTDFTLDPNKLVTPGMAAKLLNVTERTAKAILPVAGLAANCKPLVSLEHLAVILPPSDWPSTMIEVTRDLNPCRCLFWDTQTNGCGVQPERAIPERGTAHLTCEDYTDECDFG